MTPIAQSSAPRVDAHAHLYTLDMPLAGTAWHRPPTDANVDSYLQTLDEHSVQYAVLAAASLYGDYNDYQIDACRKHQRLRTTVLVRPDVERYVLEKMKDDGVVGIRLQWRRVQDTPDLDSFEYRRLLRRVRDLDWHVHINDDALRLARPMQQLEAAGVKIVVDHFGNPANGIDCEGFQSVLRAIERGRTWVKLSAGFRQTSAQAPTAHAQALLKTGGPERLFWGSDWPFAAYESSITYQNTVDDFARWIPDPAIRQQIHDNAYKFYFS